MQTTIKETWKLQRGMIAAGCEAVATVADTVGAIWHRIASTEEVTSAPTWGESARASANPLEKATEEVIRGMGQFPRNVLGAYDRAYFAEAIREYPTERLGQVRSERGAEPRREFASDLELATFSRARREIRENHGKGALLSDFVFDIARDFDVSDETVRKLIARHFLVRGDVVREKHETDRPERTTLRERLHNLGYADVREDVPLQLINDCADLIAFEEGTPKILCYRRAANANDLKARRQARLQACSYSEGKNIPYIWVTDGAVDYYADVDDDRAVTELPRASVPKSSAPKASAPK